MSLGRAMVSTQVASVETGLLNQVSPGGRLSDLFLRDGDSLSHARLAGFWRRSLRNGSWAMLDIAEKGLFRCALWVTKARGKISNTRLMVQVLRIALKLLKNYKSRISKVGRERATMMLQAYAKPGGVFGWAPRMREWLHNPRYVWYLGVMEVNQ